MVFANAHFKRWAWNSARVANCCRAQAEQRQLLCCWPMLLSLSSAKRDDDAQLIGNPSRGIISPEGHWKEKHSEDQKRSAVRFCYPPPPPVKAVFASIGIGCLPSEGQLPAVPSSSGKCASQSAYRGNRRAQMEQKKPVEVEANASLWFVVVLCSFSVVLESEWHGTNWQKGTFCVCTICTTFNFCRCFSTMSLGIKK